MRLIDADALKQAIEDHFDNLDTYFPNAFIKEIEDAPAVEYPQETRVPKSEGTVSFKVIDKKTGKEPIFDHNHLFKQRWFKDSNLIWCDIEGWFIGEDGCLILADECGNFVYAPMDRYVPIMERPQGEWIATQVIGISDITLTCSNCKDEFIGENDIDTWKSVYHYCPSCGAYMG